MANLFLHIVVKDEKISAAICDSSSKNNDQIDGRTILFKDLPPVETDQSLFEQSMYQISQSLDLSECKEAIVLLPASRFFFRSSRLPFRSKTKIRQVLPLELKSTFPVVDQAVLTDFSILDSISDESVKLIFSASISELDVKDIYECLKQYNIKPTLLSVNGLVTAAGFMDSQKKTIDCLFVDMGEDEITACLIIGKKIVHVRTFPVDYSSLFCLHEELNRMLMGYTQQSDLETMVDIRVALGTNSDLKPGEIQESLKETMAFQAGLISQTLKSETGSNDHPVIDILNRDALKFRLKPDQGNRHLFNLCQGRYGSQSFIKKYASNIVVSSVLSVLVCALFMAQVYGQVAGLEKKVEQKKQIIVDIFKKSFPHRKIGAIDPLLLMKSSIREERKNKGNSKSSDTPAGQKTVPTIEVISALSTLIPKTIDIELSRMILDSEKMTISGSTANFNAVDQIKGYIEKSKIFKKVEISSASAGKRGKRVDFKFIVEMAHD